MDGASDYSSASKKFAKNAVWCACHRMHLISDKIINDNADLKTIITRGKQVATFWNSSINYQRALIEKQKEFGKLHGRNYPRLQTGIYTRWNSHIKMIRSLIISKEVFEAIPEVRHLLVTADQWSWSQRMLQLMELFEETLLSFENSKLPTINKVFPLHMRIKQLIRDDRAINRQFYHDFSDLLEQYFGINEDLEETIKKCSLFIVSAFVDHRTKISNLHLCCGGKD